LIAEDEINILYSDSDNFMYMEEILRDQDVFLRELANFDREKFIKVYEALQTLKEDHTALREMVFKLRRIIKATIVMSTSLMLDEAIHRIVEETCECLECDRATTFIYDSVREELWSKAAKGSDATIRVPSNKGIVGNYVPKVNYTKLIRACIHKRRSCKYT